jgi:hypothetical protein
VYLELVDGATLDKLRHDPPFRPAVPYPPEFKLPSGIGNALSRHPRD